MQIHKGVMLDTGGLIAHPDTPVRAVTGVGYTLSLEHTGLWNVGCMIGAVPSALALPSSTQPTRADDLWRTTCFEMFLLDEATGCYFEFNFSPSGQWAIYHFSGYRDGMSNFDGPAPLITTTAPAQFDDAMKHLATQRGIDPKLTSFLSLDRDFEPVQFALSASWEAPPLPGTGPWRMGLSAVVQEIDGTKSCWALRHPPGPPDFHHPDCFALTLPAPPPA